MLENRVGGLDVVLDAPILWMTGPHEQDRSQSILKVVYECLKQ